MSGAELVGIAHVHSDYSRDGHDSLEQLYDFAVGRGIGFIALSDHAEDLDPARFEQYRRHCEALSDSRVRLFPGLEFRFTGFTGLHLLALGLREWIDPPTPEAFIAAAPRAAALTMLAHPKLTDYKIPVSVSEAIQSVEVWNAAYNTRYLPDPRAIRLLHGIRESRADVFGIAGLDQHDSRNDRELRVGITSRDDEPLSAMRKGKFRNIGPYLSMTPSCLDSWQMPMLRAARWVLDTAEAAQVRFAPAGRAQ
jgi:hypothetical protein